MDDCECLGGKLVVFGENISSKVEYTKIYAAERADWNCGNRFWEKKFKVGGFSGYRVIFWVY